LDPSFFLFPSLWTYSVFFFFFFFFLFPYRWPSQSRHKSRNSWYLTSHVRFSFLASHGSVPCFFLSQWNFPFFLFGHFEMLTLPAYAWLMLLLSHSSSSKIINPFSSPHERLASLSVTFAPTPPSFYPWNLVMPCLPEGKCFGFTLPPPPPPLPSI